MSRIGARARGWLGRVASGSLHSATKAEVRALYAVVLGVFAFAFSSNRNLIHTNGERLKSQQSVLAQLAHQQAQAKYQQVQLAEEREHDCAGIRVVASVAKDTLDNQIKLNKRLLPKLNFPGLTHAELVKLINQIQTREKRHVRELQAVRRTACMPARPAN